MPLSPGVAMFDATPSDNGVSLSARELGHQDEIRRLMALSSVELTEEVNTPPEEEPQSDDDGGEVSEGHQAGEQLDLTNKLYQGRTQFSIGELLPADLASAVDLLQQPLPTDDLTAVMALLAGYSGLLKLGTRVASSVGYSVPANLFVSLVMPSGGGKTPIRDALVKSPAADIKKDAFDDWKRRQTAYDATPKKERPEKRPHRILPHIQDYNPASLNNQLQLCEEFGLGVLVTRDELSGLLAAVSMDSQRGSGTGEAQLLETFDGEEYTGLRVEAGVRSYSSCHVSVYGNIQPRKLKELINGEDETGMFARFLFVRVPNGDLNLQDADLTDEEEAAHNFAVSKLRDYANRLNTEPPRVYRLSADARAAYNAWLKGHRRNSQLPYVPGVVGSLLGKTGAHALRVAGNLHLLRVVAGELTPDDKLSRQTMVAAMAIVDQLVKETQAFHEDPDSPMSRLMRHIHQLSWIHGDGVTGREVDCRLARAKSGGQLRQGCTAETFNDAVGILVSRGYGTTVDNGMTLNGKRKKARYQATRGMAL